jgi:hypothetical protein
MNLLRFGMLAVAMGLMTVVGGCSEPGPPLGTACKVHFRRDALGGSTELPVSVTTDSYNGAEVSISGKLAQVTDQWIVLTIDIPEHQGGGHREYWIPRQAVLLIQLDRPPIETSETASPAKSTPTPPVGY